MADKAERLRLIREALEFYGQRENHKVDPVVSWDKTSLVQEDYGAKARDALRQVKELEKGE